MNVAESLLPAVDGQQHIRVLGLIWVPALQRPHLHIAEGVAELALGLEDLQRQGTVETSLDLIKRSQKVSEALPVLVTVAIGLQGGFGLLDHVNGEINAVYQPLGLPGIQRT